MIIEIAFGIVLGGVFLWVLPLVVELVWDFLAVVWEAMID